MKKITALMIAIGITLGVGIAKRDVLKGKAYNVILNYEISQAAKYLPAAIKVLEEDGDSLDDFSKWENDNVTFSGRKDSDMLSISKKDEEEPAYRVFHLVDNKRDGSLDGVVIESFISSGNGWVYERRIVTDKESLLPFQYDYTFFLKHFAKRDLEGIEKKYPAPVFPKKTLPGDTLI